MQKYVRNTATALAVALGLAGIGAVLYTWRLPPFSSAVETTDNAYVRGYVTLISPQLSGYVTEVPVKDYEAVRKGDVLARLDDRIYRQKVEQARATLASQQAALANSEEQQKAAEARIAASAAAVDSARFARLRAEENRNRVEALSSKGIVAESDREQGRTALDQAKAALAQAQAALEVSRQDLQTLIVGRDSLRAAVAGAEAAVRLAEIDLSNTVVTAPRDGTVGEVGVKLGQYVAAGSQLMAVVPAETWVIANFKETQLAHIQAGQKVVVTVDALGHAALAGHVERFSPAAGSEFSIIRPDNATGNFTKVAQRVPVRIAVDEGQEAARRLVPGLSVEVTTVVE